MNTKRLFIIKDKIDDSIFKRYAQLVLTIGHLEWFLQEILIFMILKTQFDQSNKSHAILADFISKANFDKKIELIRRNNLLNTDLMEKLDEIRKKRNIFIHGIILQEKDGIAITSFHKNIKENFDDKNISIFLDFVEITGGQLISEFELQGFKLQS